MMKVFMALLLAPVLSKEVFYIIMMVGVVMILTSVIEESLILASVQFDFVAGALVLLAIYLLVLMYYSCEPLPSNKLVIIFWGLLVILFSLFSVSSTLLFYFCFELSLIPMALMILGWGYQPERLVATLYMLFYTFSSSFPFLVLVLALSSPRLMDVALHQTGSILWSLESFILLLPFLVKMPMFFFHLWLPKAHVEAPAYGSMVLAGVLLKIGGYGIWRLGLSFDPLTSSGVGAVAISGGALASILAVCQVDIKSMIAYSSVVHMGLVVYALVVLSYSGMVGGFMMMIAHGVSSSGLFCMATYSYERFNTRSLLIGRGSMLMVPSLSLLWVWLLLMNLSAPPSWNLLSELLMTTVAVSTNSVMYFWLGGVLVMGLIFTLYLFTLHHHGSLTPLYSVSLETPRELVVGVLHSQWWVLSPMVFYLFD